MDGLVPSILIVPPLIMLPLALAFLIIFAKLLFVVINVPLVVIVFMVMET
jgi:hypothetical protein